MWTHGVNTYQSMSSKSTGNHWGSTIIICKDILTTTGLLFIPFYLDYIHFPFSVPQ